MRVEGRVIRFSDWPVPRLVKTLSERPYNPDNTPRMVYVAYHGRDFTVIIRRWDVCEGTEPELLEEELSFEAWPAAKAWVAKAGPHLERIDRIVGDPVRVIATWV